MPYNVVYVFNEKSGGNYGVRRWVKYDSQSEFENAVKQTDEDVLEAGISDDKAIEILSLTPEICILMGSIEDVYRDVEKPSSERVKFAITGAMYTINIRRKRIVDHTLVRTEAKKYIAHFEKMITDDQTSFKTASMKGLMVCLINNHTGEVL